MIIPDWIPAVEYPGMFWTGVAVVCGFAVYLAWGIWQIAKVADEYDADSLKDGDDDRDPPAGAA